MSYTTNIDCSAWNGQYDHPLIINAVKNAINTYSGLVTSMDSQLSYDRAELKQSLYKLSNSIGIDPYSGSGTASIPNISTITTTLSACTSAYNITESTSASFLCQLESLSGTVQEMLVGYAGSVYEIPTSTAETVLTDSESTVVAAVSASEGTTAAETTSYAFTTSSKVSSFQSSIISLNLSVNLGAFEEILNFASNINNSSIIDLVDNGLTLLDNFISNNYLETIVDTLESLSELTVDKILDNLSTMLTDMISNILVNLASAAWDILNALTGGILGIVWNAVKKLWNILKSLLGNLFGEGEDSWGDTTGNVQTEIGGPIPDETYY